MESWDSLENLEVPELDSPARFEDARRLGVSDTDRFRVELMPGWPFDVCRYMRKIEICFVDLMDQSFMGLGNAKRLRKLQRLYARANSCRRTWPS